jgi:hypothetical protein
MKVWLEGIVEESNTTCPQMQRFVRLFAMRSPKSMHSKAVKELNNGSTNNNNDNSLSSSNHSTSSSQSGHYNDMRSRSADETNTMTSLPMFSLSDIRPRSGSVCSEESNLSDLSDMSENTIQGYVGGPHSTTSSLVHDYATSKFNVSDLTTLSEDTPKTFTTPKKAPIGRISPVRKREKKALTPPPSLPSLLVYIYVQLVFVFTFFKIDTYVTRY